MYNGTDEIHAMGSHSTNQGEDDLDSDNQSQYF